jgi:hypothetical protein
VFTEVAQFVIEFVTSAEVGGFAGDNFLGVAAATAGAAAAALLVLVVAANEVPARSKTMNVNDFILAKRDNQIDQNDFLRSIERLSCKCIYRPATRLGKLRID